MKIYKQQTKETVQTQEQQHRLDQDQVTKKNKGNFIYYIIAVVCATAFFAHETIVLDYSNITNATTKWEASKEKRTMALEAIKNSVDGTQLHDQYLIEKEATQKDYDALMDEHAKMEFLKFKSFQEWLGEFGWALGLFIYSFFNLCSSLIRRSKTLVPETILHSTLITIAVFFISWSFNRGDFSLPKYFIFNILTAALTVWSAHLFVKYKEKILVDYNILKKGFASLSRFTTITAKKHVKEDEIEEYTDGYLGALNEGLE